MKIENTFKKKKVVYINSYHKGFPPSDQITNAFEKGLPNDIYQISSFFMDTKRNPSESYIIQRAEELLDVIHTLKRGLNIPIFEDDTEERIFIEAFFAKQEYKQ